MKSARVAAYWYATAIVLVASALMRGLSRPLMFPWWFVGAEMGAGIVFGVLAWWLGRGASLARLLLLVAGAVVVLGAVALLVTDRGYEFGAVPAVLGLIVTATGGEVRGRSQQVSVSAVGDWPPAPVAQPAGPQPFGPSPAQPWASRRDGGPQGQPPWRGNAGTPSRAVPPQHDTQPRWQQPPPQHGTQPQWPDPRRTAPQQHPTVPPHHPTGPPQHPTLPPQHPTVPPQHPTAPPQHPTGPPQRGTYPPPGPPSHQPPARGAPGDPPWRRVPGPSVPALPDEPAAPPPEQGDADGVPPARARHAAQPAPDAEPRPAADPEVQWAPRRRRHARPEQTEGGSDPSHQEPEEN